MWENRAIWVGNVSKKEETEEIRLVKEIFMKKRKDN